MDPSAVFTYGFVCEGWIALVPYGRVSAHDEPVVTAKMERPATPAGWVFVSGESLCVCWDADGGLGARGHESRV
jgi:hypothetical protein